MKMLYIFDADASVNSIDRLEVDIKDAVHLFPLTSRTAVLNAALDIFRKKGCEVKIINAADKINLSSDAVRGTYLRFISELPDKLKYQGVDIKKIFALDGHVSLWWFGLIAEKNTYKSDSFFRLAQFDAVTKIIESEKIKGVVCGVKSGKLSKTLAGYCADNGIRYRDLSAYSMARLISASSITLWAWTVVRRSSRNSTPESVIRTFSPCRPKRIGGD